MQTPEQRIAELEATAAALKVRVDDLEMKPVPASVVITALQKRAEQAERRAAALARIAWLIGSIYVHGDFKAETANERELESLLRANGTFWETLADFDAALAQSAQQSAIKRKQPSTIIGGRDHADDDEQQAQMKAAGQSEGTSQQTGVAPSVGPQAKDEPAVPAAHDYDAVVKVLRDTILYMTGRGHEHMIIAMREAAAAITALQQERDDYRDDSIRLHKDKIDQMERADDFARQLAYATSKMHSEIAADRAMTEALARADERELIRIVNESIDVLDKVPVDVRNAESVRRQIRENRAVLSALGAT